MSESDACCSLFAGPGVIRATCREIDWEQNPLGPVEDWPPSLRAMVSLCLDSPTAMSVWAGPDLVLIYNDAYSHVFGPDRHPWALGRSGREVWSTFWDWLGPELERVMQGASSYHESKRVALRRRKDEDEELWFNYSHTPIRDNGRVVGLLNIVHEYVEVRSVMRAGVERTAFLLTLADELRQLTDHLEIQNTATRMLGTRLGVSRVQYYEADATGEYVESFGGYADGVPLVTGRFRLADFHPEDYEAGRPIAVRNVATDERLRPGQREIFEAYNCRALVSLPLLKNGAIVCVLSVGNVHPFDWSDDQIEMMQQVAERTWASTERARAQAALHEMVVVAQAARAEAETARRANDAFLAVVSHELRTPLAPLLLWSRGLWAGTVRLHQYPQAFDAIVQSAESQCRIIDDLLDLARLQSGKFTLVPQPRSVEALVRRAIAIIQPAVHIKDIALSVEIDATLGLVMLDAERVQQLLCNLLGNAVKFTPAGGRVWVHARRLDHELVFEIGDTGLGIAPGFLQNMFLSFAQQVIDGQGLGIGLALCRRLVELHGGTIEAQSEGLGRGAVFTVRLPYQPATAPESIPSVLGEPLKADTKVLLIEDDKNTREAIQCMLENAGAAVTAVGSGTEAVKVAEVSAFDAIVCDIGLPDTTGFELISKINGIYRTRNLPLVPACAVSAHARRSDQQEAISAGFHMHLAKPVEVERLIDAVRTLTDMEPDA